MRTVWLKTAQFFLLFVGIVVGLVFLAGLSAGQAAKAQKVNEGTGSTPMAHLPIILYQPLPTSTPQGHPSAIELVPFATISDMNSQTVTDITNAGDGRLYVALREGVVRIIEADGTVLPTPFLNISDRVGLDNWEQGLLGIAFHPNYPTTPYVYIAYTHEDSPIYLERYSRSSSNHDIVDPTSQVIMMLIPKPIMPPPFNTPSLVHNGGDLNFGPDGYLYMSVGDGGPDPLDLPGEPGDPNNHGQREDTLLAKILRLDVNNATSFQPDCGMNGYSIPANNPLRDGQNGRCDEIWSKGFRNPWRFSFDRLTGDMFIGDVGEWEREEINMEPAGVPGGRNYGWHCWEGLVNYQFIHPEVANDCGDISLYTFSVFEYDNPLGSTEDCSVIGGFVYRGSQYPLLYGHYILADFCRGRIRLLYPGSGGNWDNVYQSDTLMPISTFGEAANGELYVGTWSGGNEPKTIYHVVVP